MSFELPVGTHGLRLARITNTEELILCEPIKFDGALPAVDTVLRRAAVSGRVEVDGNIDYHFADILDGDGDMIGTVALDAKSYGALKNKWMRCKVEQGHGE